MTFVLFIIIFSAIVISHEFGHFFLARVTGIRVKEFFVGIGPKLVKIQRGDTEYSIRLLPLGGACVFDSFDPMEHQEGEPFEEGTFQAASVWARISTVLAGPVFNFILAYLLALIIVASCGVTKATVGQVTEGGAAWEAGIKEGDVIRRVDGKRVHLFYEFSTYVGLNDGREMTLEIVRDGEKRNVILTPIYEEETDRYYIGIRSTMPTLVKGPELFVYGAYEVKRWVDLTFESFSMLFRGQASVRDLGGPVAVAQTVGETYKATASDGAWTVILNMMNLTVLLSVNLGIINLLPLPALDGGRLLFLLLEVLRGKPVPPEKEGIVHFVGMAALVVLMVFVMYNDITRLFTATF